MRAVRACGRVSCVCTCHVADPTLGASPIGMVTASNGQVNSGQYAIVSLPPSPVTYYAVASNNTGCQVTGSDEVLAGAGAPALRHGPSFPSCVPAITSRLCFHLRRPYIPWHRQTNLDSSSRRRHATTASLAGSAHLYPQLVQTGLLHSSR